MRRTASIALLLAASSCAGQCEPDPLYADPPGGTSQPGPTIELAGLDALAHRPLVQLVDWVRDYDLFVPAFTLYEDGLVIYQDESAERFHKLRRANIGAARAGMLAYEIAGGGFFELPGETDVCPVASDMYNVEILARARTRWHFARVRGLTPNGTSACERNPRTEAEIARYAPPPAFMHAYLLLVEFRGHDTRPWQPARVDLEMHGSKASGHAVPWPVGLPPLPATATPTSYEHHYIDGRFADQAHALVTQPRTVFAANGFDWWFYPHDCVPEEAYLEEVVREIRSRER